MIIFPEKWKQMDKKQVGVVFLVGILLIIIAMPISEDASEILSSEGVVDVDAGEIEMVSDTEEVWNEMDYKALLEDELEAILASVEGVGQVQVMITLQTTTEKVVEKDSSISESTQSEETVYGEADGNQMPYVIQEVYPEIAGVIVAAEGGGSSVVVQNITEAIQALFGVDTHKIKIMKLIS